jgi:hypothetical protein
MKVILLMGESIIRTYDKKARTTKQNNIDNQG